MRIFVQDQGAWKILPQAYGWYSEDKIFRATMRLGEKAILQGSHMTWMIISLSESTMTTMPCGYGYQKKTHHGKGSAQVSSKKSASQVPPVALLYRPDCDFLVCLLIPQQYRFDDIWYPLAYERFINTLRYQASTLVLTTIFTTCGGARFLCEKVHLQTVGHRRVWGGGVVLQATGKILEKRIE